jgi:hypothetical protein
VASKVQVYNLAGAAIGSGTRVTDPADDTTLARGISGVWDLQRRAAIREGSWNFATRRKRVAALATAPDFGFEAQFQLPAGILRFLEAQVDGRQVTHYKLEGGRILCDESGPLDVIYMIDEPEPARWDDAFAEAFALRIAWKIGTKIAGSNFDTEKCWRDYQDALSTSKRVDAAENPPIEQEESEWILARHRSAEAGMGTWVPES